jgi:hypothetical protein
VWKAQQAILCPIQWTENQDQATQIHKSGIPNSMLRLKVDADDIENRAGIGGTGDRLPARASPTAARKRATSYGRDVSPVTQLAKVPQAKGGRQVPVMSRYRQGQERKNGRPCRIVPCRHVQRFGTYSTRCSGASSRANAARRLWAGALWRKCATLRIQNMAVKGDCVIMATYGRRRTGLWGSARDQSLRTNGGKRITINPRNVAHWAVLMWRTFV